VKPVLQPLHGWSLSGKTAAPPLTTDEVLREEAAAIHHADLSGVHPEEIYRTLNALNSAALCLSGGGIRSAAFALGIMQSLAAHPRQENGDPVGEPQQSLLAQFHYLSSVSGGGYIGSWLSAWLARANFRTVWSALVGRPAGADNEPAPIAWLRSYSNYLTPQLGLMSADTWAIVAVYLRNLVLNWLVILPVLCGGILLLKLMVVVLTGFSYMNHALRPRLVLVGVGIVFLVMALRYVTRHRPSRQADQPSEVHGGDADKRFIAGSLIWSLFSAVILTQYLAIIDVSGSVVKTLSGLPSAHVIFAGAGAVVGAVIYALGWIVGWPRRRNLLDFVLWCAAGSVYGALVAFGFYVYLQVPDIARDAAPGEVRSLLRILNSPVTYLIVGVPYILISQWIADMVFVGLTSFQKQFNAEQEWLGRASGWLLVTAVGWNVLIFLTFAGFLAGALDTPAVSFFVGYFMVPICVLWGLVIALVGTFSTTRFTFERRGIASILMNTALGAAAPLFVGAMIFSLSIGLDYLLLDGHLFGPKFRMMTDGLKGDTPDYVLWHETMLRLTFGAALAALIAIVASRCININRFSLHALYRNRLIRAFLGASRERTPDPFTGLDADDDRRMHQLWPPCDAMGHWPRCDVDDWRPFHVLNLTLNIVSSKRLAWQERKAAPFTVSPLHCGTSSKSEISTKEGGNTQAREAGAYRPSRLYGDRDGMSLGTAMAISGAAANPNMGYHSSPSVALLMTMFNVRLGWWLGNPGREGEKTFTHEGPAIAILPLVQETFGLTTDTRKYVHVSDGGHFENLGLYEMVRRRCRLIVISDAGRDPTYAFEDLGNAVRKIAIDLGVPIRFHRLEALKRRPVDSSDILTHCDYHAIADIDYQEADGKGVENGLILYVKAGYHGTESAGVRSYAMANLDFPHQSTANQWFTESQFESYRSLGFEIMEDLLYRASKSELYAKTPNLQNLLAVLRNATLVAQHNGEPGPPRSRQRDVPEYGQPQDASLSSSC
jgi:hypothetical protein